LKHQLEVLGAPVEGGKKLEENAGGKEKPEPGWRQEVGETCWSGP